MYRYTLHLHTLHLHAPHAFRISLCICLTAILLFPLAGVSAEAYRLFRGDGAAATMDELVEAVKDAEVVFVGESHDDLTAHELELLLLQKMAQLGPVQLSLEMFETDVQMVLEEYLRGQISEEHLLKSGRAWNNYKTD